MTNEQLPQPGQDEVQSFMQKYGEWAQTLTPGEQAIALSVIAHTATAEPADVEGFGFGTGALIDFQSLGPAYGWAPSYGLNDASRAFQTFQSWVAEQAPVPDVYFGG